MHSEHTKSMHIAADTHRNRPHQGIDQGAGMTNETKQGATMTNQEAILKALGICHTLTYNEEPQGSAKHMLRELAHRLDTARTLNADQVAVMLAGINRYLPPAHHPRVSRAREVQAYGLLYELMEVAGLSFADDVAAHNATPQDVFGLHSRNQRRAGDRPAAAGQNTAGVMGAQPAGAMQVGQGA